MREFIVSLDLETKNISDNDFRNIFGLDPSWFEQKEEKDNKIWKMESDIDPTSALESHMTSVLKRISFSPFFSAKRKSEFLISLNINIGIMYDTLTCSFYLPPNVIELINRYNLGLEVSCYPTDFNANEPESHASEEGS